MPFNNPVLVVLCEFQNERIILKNLLLFFLNKQLKICAFVGCHLPMLAANRTAASEAKQKLTEKKCIFIRRKKETKIFA